ncbi:MAG: phosphodiester glycosidase family protein, partial [Chthoniobacterales bacterium]
KVELSLARWLVPTAGFFAAVVAAQAGWTITQSEVHPGKSDAVHRVEVSAEESGNGDSAEVQLAVFDFSRATLRVVDQPQEPRTSLAPTMQRDGCLAGVNGGYFDPNYAPVGMLVSQGKVVQGKQKARLLSGVVSVISGKIQIQRADAFSPKAKPSAARQCGPFLVERGQAITGLNNDRSARRTFVLVGDNRRAAIGYASSVTLSQLGALLATPGLAPELKVQSALNLDGGSSSGFWFAGTDGAFSIREQKTVRDFLAVVAKP